MSVADLPPVTMPVHVADEIAAAMAAGAATAAAAVELVRAIRSAGLDLGHNVEAHMAHVVLAATDTHHKVADARRSALLAIADEAGL
ncbi:MAG: hypothetical protein M0P31_16990 [Solirubrobacteraceae bacterium]|nr:hypothetical protein [Solirubrobacteraceae bacterium]